MKPHFASPIFYADHACKFLLAKSPALYVNVFRVNPDMWDGKRYAFGPTHQRHTTAEANNHTRRYGYAVYRIVIKPKRVLA